MNKKFDKYLFISYMGIEKHQNFNIIYLKYALTDKDYNIIDKDILCQKNCNNPLNIDNMINSLILNKFSNLKINYVHKIAETLEPLIDENTLVVGNDIICDLCESLIKSTSLKNINYFKFQFCENDDSKLIKIYKKEIENIKDDDYKQIKGFINTFKKLNNSKLLNGIENISKKDIDKKEECFSIETIVNLKNKIYKIFWSNYMIISIYKVCNTDNIYKININLYSSKYLHKSNIFFLKLDEFENEDILWCNDVDYELNTISQVENILKTQMADKKYYVLYDDFFEFDCSKIFDYLKIENIIEVINLNTLCNDFSKIYNTKKRNIFLNELSNSRKVIKELNKFNEYKYDELEEINDELITLYNYSDLTFSSFGDLYTDIKNFRKFSEFVLLIKTVLIYSNIKCSDENIKQTLLKYINEFYSNFEKDKVVNSINDRFYINDYEITCNYGRFNLVNILMIFAFSKILKMLGYESGPIINDKFLKIDIMNYDKLIEIIKNEFRYSKIIFNLDKDELENKYIKRLFTLENSKIIILKNEKSTI